MRYMGGHKPADVVVGVRMPYERAGGKAASDYSNCHRKEEAGLHVEDNIDPTPELVALGSMAMGTA